MPISKSFLLASVVVFYLTSTPNTNASPLRNQYGRSTAIGHLPAKIDVSTLGDCKNLQIDFGVDKAGVGGSFRPNDTARFSQESNDIGMVTNSMCEALVNNCGFKNEDQVTVDCRSLAKDVGSGSDSALADRWNSGCGISTNFAGNQTLPAHWNGQNQSHPALDGTFNNSKSSPNQNPPPIVFAEKENSPEAVPGGSKIPPATIMQNNPTDKDQTGYVNEIDDDCEDGDEGNANTTNSPNIHNPPESYGIPSSPNPGGNSSPTPKDQPNTPVGYRDQPQPTQQGEPGKPNKPVNQNQPQGRPQGKRDSPNVNPGGGYTQPTPNNQPIGPEGSGNKDQPVPLGGLNNPNEAQNWSPPHNPPKGKADSPNVIPGGGYIKHTPFNQPAVPVESNEKTQPVPQGVPNKPNEAQKQGPPQSPSKGKTDSPNVTTGGGYTQPTPNNQPTAPGKNDKFQSVPQGVPTKPNEAQNKNPPQEKVDSPNTSTGGGYTQNDPKNQPALPGTPVDQSKSIPQGVPSKTNVFIPQNPPQGKVDSPNVIPGVVNTTPTFKGQQSPSDGSNGKGGSEPTADDDCEDEIDEDVSDFNMQLPPQAPSSPNPGSNSSPTPKDQPNTPVGYRDQPQPAQQGEPVKPNKPVDQNQPQGRPQGNRDSPNVNPGGGYTQPTPNNQTFGSGGFSNKTEPIPQGAQNKPNETQKQGTPQDPPKVETDLPDVIPGGSYTQPTSSNQPSAPGNSGEKSQPVPQGVPNKPKENQNKIPTQENVDLPSAKPHEGSDSPIPVEKKGIESGEHLGYVEKVEDTQNEKDKENLSKPNSPNSQAPPQATKTEVNRAPPVSSVESATYL